MKVIILGCGRIGSTLAKSLHSQGHEVVVIDQRSSALSRLRGGEGIKTIIGLGIEQETMKRAGIEQADAFIAVTNGDNTNIMAAQIAQRIFAVPKVTARLYDPIRAHAYQKMGMNTICSTLVLSGMIEDYLFERPWEDRLIQYLNTPAGDSGGTA